MDDHPHRYAWITVNSEVTPFWRRRRFGDFAVDAVARTGCKAGCNVVSEITQARGLLTLIPVELGSFNGIAVTAAGTVFPTHLVRQVRYCS
jgi:hypothetical protein